MFVCCDLETRPGRLCYVAPPEPGGCTSGRLLGPPVGRCTRTPLQAPTCPYGGFSPEAVWPIHPEPHADSPGPPEGHTGRPAVEPRAPQGGEPPWRPVLKRVPCFATYGTPHRPPEGWLRCQVTRVPVRLSAYPGFPIGVSFSTPAGYFTHLHRTEHDPTRVAPCCNLAWERTPGLSPLVSACLCVARFGTPGAESGSEVIKHVRRKRDGERENRPGAFRPEAWRR